MVPSIITAILILVACQKDDENHKVKDTEKPTILVTSPIECSEHSTGTEVHIEATFSDDVALKNYEVYMSDDEYVEDTSFHFHHSGVISAKTHEFHEHFVVPIDPYNWRYVFFTVTDATNKTAAEAFILHFAP